jgi:hypothetical protein
MSPALALHHRRRLVPAILFALAAIGSALIILSSVAYVLPSGEHPFLDERPALAADLIWRLSLGVHVAGGIFCLPVGLLLLVRRAAVALPRVHKVIGRLYAAAFLLLVTPTGVLLAFYAKGGWTTGPGFVLSSIFSAFAFAVAVRAATERRLVAHEAWMLRSYMQLASAITFRVVHIALQFTDVPYDQNYILSIWGSVLGNAALAELIIAAQRHRRRSHAHA